MLVNYGVAALSVTFALFIARWLQIQFGYEPLVPFLFAIAFGAWFGGVRPGLFAVALSILAFQYYVISPVDLSSAEKEMQLPRLLFAALTGVLVLWLSTAQRKAMEALRESEQRYLSLFENMAEGVAYLRMLFEDGQPRDALYLEVNPAWHKLTGLTNVVGRKASELTPDARKFDADFIERSGRVAITGQPERFEIYSAALKKWLSVSAYCPGKEHIIVVLDDISERKRAEHHLRLVIDTIPTMAWSLLPDGTVDFVNQRWMEYTGLSLTEALANANRVVHPEDLAEILEKWRVDMAAGRPCEYEMRLRRADGEYRWFLVRTVPLSDERGKVVKWYGTSTDIEDRKRAGDALRDSGVQLQALSRRLVELQESERKDLARELHDRVGQNLTALKINLDILQPVLASQENEEIVARVADSAALLESTMDTIENVMSELRPPMLDHHGLASALHWHARNFSKRTGIAVAVRGSDPAVRPAPQVEIALFRIAQEALNNVAKHAGARRVDIALDQANGECVMSVEDDGIGFSTTDGADKQQPGLGMVTMRERSQAVGGRFEVRALPERGTQLIVRVPY
ncbi:MAG TPA: PAS domain S-box protein [Burkholderiales bacterium]